MKISYKPLWRTLVEHNMMKKDLMKAAHLTSNHIANMGKGQHIVVPPVVKTQNEL